MSHGPLYMVDELTSCPQASYFPRGLKERNLINLEADNDDMYLKMNETAELKTFSKVKQF